MRSIKFRVWDTEKKEMCDAHQLDLVNQFAAYGSREERYGPPDSEYFHAKLMQYTGLTDKNGKEVYEGDLLRRTYNPEDDWEKVNYVAYEVFFHDNDCADKHIGFQMNRLHFHGSIAGTSEFINFLPKYVKNFEIIGNIYENPELLK